MKSKIKCIFKDEDVMKCLTSLQQKYVIVPADKASNNVVFVCKSYYINCLHRELENSNNTYTPTTLSKRQIIDNQLSVLSSFGINVKSDDQHLPSMYWLPKLHKTPYKERYIASSYKCSTKELSVLLTKTLTVIKDDLQKYCNTVYSHSGVNQMLILKNSKTLLENLKSKALRTVTNISTYDFSTLYTTIPHDLLKSRLAQLIKDAFFL